MYDRAIEHITQASKLTVESSHAAKEVRICVCCSWYVCRVFVYVPRCICGWCLTCIHNWQLDGWVASTSEMVGRDSTYECECMHVCMCISLNY